MKFAGELRFLSNFWPCGIWFDGFMYRSVESAYQAAKTLDPVQRFPFTDMTAGDARRAGRQLRIRADWDAVKVEIMKALVRQKFQDPYLRKKLAAVTGEIVEHNVWHDNFWGACICAKCASRTKHNNMGKILMEVRDV